MWLIDANEFMKTVLRMKRLNEECPLSDIDLENEKINNYETGQRETFDLITEHLDAQPTAYDPDKVVEQLEERTAFLNGCTKYDNETAEQQKKSYDTMMMYEVKDLVDDLLEIVKEGGVNAKTDS